MGAARPSKRAPDESLPLSPPPPPPPPTLTSASRTTTTITGGIMAAPVSYSTLLLLSAHVLYRCAYCTHTRRDRTQGREADRQRWRGVGPTLGGWVGGREVQRRAVWCPPASHLSPVWKRSSWSSSSFTFVLALFLRPVRGALVSSDWSVPTEKHGQVDRETTRRCSPLSFFLFPPFS